MFVIKWMRSKRLHLSDTLFANREVGLEIDIYPHTNGSSRVVFGNNGTEVKAAVKVSKFGNFDAKLYVP